MHQLGSLPVGRQGWSNKPLSANGRQVLYPRAILVKGISKYNGKNIFRQDVVFSSLCHRMSLVLCGKYREA